MNERLDGRPRRSWKWTKDQLSNHINSEYMNVDRSLLQHFKGCHDRVRDGKAPSIQWTRTKRGYLAFCKAIGPKPKKKGKWSVGRIKHHLGYQKGNIRWELHTFNSIKRRGTRYQNSTAESRSAL